MSEDNGGEPTAVVNPDGSFVEDWHKSAPKGYEDLHEDKSLSTVKGLWDLGKSFVHVRKQVPLDKIPRPTEHFTDEEWAEFHKAGGRPETPEDYAIAKPKDFPDDLWNGDRVPDWQTFFHGLGLSKKQVDAIIERNNTETLEAWNNNEQSKDLAFNELKQKLKQKWGMAYEQNVHLGNIAIDKGAKEDLDLKERLLEKINADPDLLEFTSNLGSLFAEHKIVEDTGIPTAPDIQQKINDEMMKPAYLDRNHPDHKRQVQLVTQLFEQKNKIMEKTGVAG